MKRLDIEGIRERHEDSDHQKIPEWLLANQDLWIRGLCDAYNECRDDRGDLLTEVDRLQSELKPLRKIYNAVNLMLNELGAYGEITTMHDTVSDLMDELHDFDGGVYTRIDLEQTK